MNTNLKEINIGKLIEIRIKELNIPMERIVKFMSLERSEVEKMYNLKTLDSEILLKWAKLLEYDFFRLYSQHLILYSPVGNTKNLKNNKNTVLPIFRKNIYTKEIIDFIIELIDTNTKTPLQIIVEYRIPKTTLYKWIEKYKK